MAQERYFIGPQLLGEIRNTIQRVDALSPGAARPGRAVHQSLQQPVATVAQNFRIATFTGAWSIGSSKTVTFKYQTTTPNTVSATNLFFPIGVAPSVAKDCAIAKDGTAWYLIDVPFKLGTSTSIVDISASFNTSSCTITVIKTTATTNFLQLDL